MSYAGACKKKQELKLHVHFQDTEKKSIIPKKKSELCLTHEGGVRGKVRITQNFNNYVNMLCYVILANFLNFAVSHGCCKTAIRAFGVVKILGHHTVDACRSG
jgi:hypothetical protein